MLPEPYVLLRAKEGARGKKLVGSLREEGSMRSFPKHGLTGDHRVNGKGLQRWQGRVFNVCFDLMKSKTEGEQIPREEKEAIWDIACQSDSRQ